jgi:hypothetical protein
MARFTQRALLRIAANLFVSRARMFHDDTRLTSCERYSVDRLRMFVAQRASCVRTCDRLRRHKGCAKN